MINPTSKSYFYFLLDFPNQRILPLGRKAQWLLNHTSMISFSHIFSTALLKKLRIGPHKAKKKRAFLLGHQTFSRAYLDFIRAKGLNKGRLLNDAFREIFYWLDKYQTKMTVLIPSTFDISRLIDEGWELF